MYIYNIKQIKNLNTKQMNNLDHIFGDISKQLKDLSPSKLYKYKVVASFKGGKFKQVELCKTEEEAIKSIQLNTSRHTKGWVVTYYNIED
tara:strand:+ start:27 stop:296 length:270 start_codon:yes stop_codon:yes gene_type:complete